MRVNNGSGWSGTRVGRRTLVRRSVVGLAGLSGAALIGCGSSGDGGAASGGAPTSGGAGATKAPAAANAGPKRGGTLTLALATEPPGWSVFTATGSVASLNTHAYDKVIGLKTGPGVAPDSADVIPVLAEALPERPDNLTYVFKIRKGVKFQNVAPLNGRPLTIEDVKYSIDQIRNHASYRSDYSPITSVTTPDENTVILKTSAPYAPLISYLGVGNYGTWKVFPKELIEAKLTDSTSIGTGPYVRAEYKQGNEVVWKKNPDYWNKDGRPYLDTIRQLIIPDITTRDASFLTKQIDILPGGAGADEVVEMEKRAKPLGATSQNVGRNPSGQGFDTSKPPYNDIRVRQAMMLAYNREAEAKALYAGRPTQVATLMSLNDSKQPKDLPELAATQRYDVAEAKKLMAAAGQTSGFTTEIAWTPGYDAGGNYSATLQRYIGDVKTALNVTLVPKSYESGIWIKEIFRPPFNWSGMLWSSSRYYGDPDPYVSYWLHPKGIANHSRVNDPTVTALIEKQRTQVNPKERLESLLELQRLEAKNSWYMWMSFIDNTTFIHSRVKGYQYHQAYEHTEHLNVWVDDGK